jgi:hypothetical protein
VQSCVRDEGRPFRSRFPRAGFKPPQAASVKSRGGERWGQSWEGYFRQVRSGETSESKPFDDAPIFGKCCLNQGRMGLLGQVRWGLGYWACGSRRIGGVNPVQAFMRNYGNQCPDAKGEVQVVKAMRREYRCRVLGRTSPFERGRPVMRLEQRGWVKRLHFASNW